MAAARRQVSRSQVSDASPPAVDDLAAQLEELGLTGNEARVMVALLRFGTASTTALAADAGVPRTTIYQVLDALAARELAERLPGGDWPAVWTTPGRDAVMDRLVAAEEERLAMFRTRATAVRQRLAEDIPDEPEASTPYIHLLRGAAAVKRSYDQLLQEAERELLMFTRGPYAYRLGKPNSAVLELLARGVRARVLYDATEWEHPDASGYREEAAIYDEAGVESRLAETLPIKLVVVDRQVALLSISATLRGGVDYPATLLVEHEGLAEVLADAFEQRWARSRPNQVDPPAAE